MAFVIGASCIGTKDGACAVVCPVDCIHPRRDGSRFDGVDQLYIDPGGCIDCGVCVVECPVGAIFSESRVPPGQEMFVDKNADFFCLDEEDFSAKWGAPGKMPWVSSDKSATDPCA